LSPLDRAYDLTLSIPRERLGLADFNEDLVINKVSEMT
jgi:hypothetical protein